MNKGDVTQSLREAREHLSTAAQLLREKGNPAEWGEEKCDAFLGALAMVQTHVHVASEHFGSIRQSNAREEAEEEAEEALGHIQARVADAILEGMSPRDAIYAAISVVEGDGRDDEGAGQDDQGGSG